MEAKVAEVKQHPEVCAIGLVLGFIIALIVMYVYSKMAAELFTNPNDMSPAAQALVTYWQNTDPSGLSARKYIAAAPKQERLTPAQDQLYRKLGIEQMSPAQAQLYRKLGMENMSPAERQLTNKIQVENMISVPQIFRNERMCHNQLTHCQ